MKFVFLNYNHLSAGTSPITWIASLKPYMGVPEILAQKHEVDYFINADFSDEIVQNNVRYHFILKNGRSVFARKMNRSVKNTRPDIVVVLGLYFNLQLLQLRRALGQKVKIVVQSHSFNPAKGWRKYLERLSYSAVDIYFFTSKDLAVKWVDNGNFPNDTKIREILPASSVQYPIDRNIALAKTRVLGTKNLLWVGRLNQNKDPLFIVRSFLKFLKRYPDYRLYMIYQANDLENEIRAIIKENRCEENIILVGAISNADLLYWYNSVDFFISGSHNESFGIALCEAISCGVIPVVTNIPSFRNMTGYGEYGVLFEPADEDSLLIALEKTAAMDLKKEKQKILKNFEANLSFAAIGRAIENEINFRSM